MDRSVVGNVLLPTALAAAAVLGGFALGTAGGDGGCDIALVATFQAAAVGITLLAAGAIFQGRRPGAAYERGILAYGIVLFLWQPQTLVATFYAHRATLLAILAYVPLIVGVVTFTRRRAWAAAAGATLYLFAATLSLTFNVYHPLSAIGFASKYRHF